MNELKTHLNNKLPIVTSVLPLGQIKKISVFRVTGLNIFGRVGTYYLIYLFLTEMLYKMHMIVYFPENLKKILGFTSKF